MIFVLRLPLISGEAFIHFFFVGSESDRREDLVLLGMRCSCVIEIGIYLHFNLLSWAPDLRNYFGVRIPS